MILVITEGIVQFMHDKEQPNIQAPRGSSRLRVVLRQRTQQD